MQKFKNLITSNKYAISWSVCYVFLMWLILDKMFNFPMFSLCAWNRLLHAHLRGFGGFVFGILILAALPLYVATTTVIVRTGKPLFSIRIPERIKKLYTPPATEEKNVTTSEEASNQNNAPSYEIPSHLPTELHGPYMRAHLRRSYAPASAPRNDIIHPATPNPTAPEKEPELVPAGALPLPSDFNFDMPDIPTFDVPQFTNISFDDNPTSSTAEIQSPPPPQPGASEYIPYSVTEHLTRKGCEFNMDGDLIICDNLAIASHTDSDFWIADEDAWFASGKQRPSPIAALQSAAERGLKPILYLGAKNILDLDERISAWESAGITVITDLNSLNS